MKLILFFLFLLPFNSFALSIKVMTFNTMCDFCKGSDFFNYDKRIKQIHKIIEKHRPDLIALQEVRTTGQIRKILGELPDYKIISNEGEWISYADPTLIYNAKKFELLSEHRRWLGPGDGSFTLGWKYALPRQILWGVFKTKERNIIFASTHFDNLLANLLGSAYLVNKIFREAKDPVILAADTNIRTNMPEYQTLTQQVFINAFDIKKNFKVDGAYHSDKDLCYLRKGHNFPDCRVDHVLLSGQHPWQVLNYVIDTTKFNGKFPSDHRAVITEIKI